MPYINETRRIQLLNTETDHPRVSGELNYCITQLLLDYWDFHGPSYQIINDIIGALEGAKLEFYRRVAGPYEDTKIKQNGDIY